MLCYCKKCGRIVQENKNKSIQICDYCHNTLDYVPDEYLSGDSRSVITKSNKNKLIENCIKSSPEFDQYLFEHRDRDMYNKRMSDRAKMEHGKAILEGRSSNNTPKCPTCQSTNISKIGTLNRMASVGLFGLASSKIGKTHKCNSCGGTW